MQPPEGGSRADTRRALGVAGAWRTTRLLILALLAGWGMVAMVRDLAALVATPVTGTTRDGEPAPIALARCEGSLAEAHWKADRGASDAEARLRVASFELRRAELLAPVAYEARHGPDWRQLWRAPPDTASWRAEFLRRDPDGCLTRASEAALAAAAQARDPARQLSALEVLASARAALGDVAGEVEALEGALRNAPENARLWMRLAEAYARAGQFARAEAARARGLELMEEESR